MKTKAYLWVACLILAFLFGGSSLDAQKTCKVLLPDIAQSYEGGCKDGLAHGKGSAQGLDSYVGRFSRGLPQGKGTYTWADGRVYEGEWQQGLREGKGTMTYPAEGKDSIQAGFWKDDIYVGKALIPAYSVGRQSGVVRYSINKINEMGAGFRVAFYQGGRFNSDIEGLTMASESGTEYQSGRFMGIENAIVPYQVSIRYRTWNLLHTQQSDVVFEFTINEPGTFEVSITN